MTVKFTGSHRLVGVFVPKTRTPKDKLQKRGQMAFDFGMFWFKGQKHGHRPVRT
jgi:glutathione-independent formaldehyde dehydrogenase